MSKSFYLLTAFGRDRPGMVAGVTRLVFDLNGNIEDASMTRLGGEFGMMLVVGLPSTAAGARLLKVLPFHEKKLKLTLTAKPIAVSLAHARHRTQATHIISIYGTDRPGIVYQTTKALADLRINITDLNTQVLKQAGKPVYIMLLEVEIPSRAKAAALQRKLAHIGKALRLDVTLQNIESVAL